MGRTWATTSSSPRRTATCSGRSSRRTTRLTHTLSFGMIGGCEVVNYFNPSQSQWLGDPFLNDGVAYTAPVDAQYQIASNVATHPCGSKVYVERSNYTYVVNDAPSKKVYTVEGYGHPLILVWLNGHGLDGADGMVHRARSLALHDQPQRHGDLPGPRGDERHVQDAAVAARRAPERRRPCGSRSTAWTATAMGPARSCRIPPTSSRRSSRDWLGMPIRATSSRLLRGDEDGDGRAADGLRAD